MRLGNFFEADSKPVSNNGFSKLINVKFIKNEFFFYVTLFRIILQPACPLLWESFWLNLPPQLLREILF